MASIARSLSRIGWGITAGATPVRRVGPAADLFERMVFYPPFFGDASLRVKNFAPPIPRRILPPGMMILRNNICAHRTQVVTLERSMSRDRLTQGAYGG